MVSLLFVAFLGITPDEIVQKVIDVDPYGFNNASVSVRVILKDKAKRTSEIAFTSLSMRYDAKHSKSIMRFTSPVELNGAGFLQIQKQNQDDDRFLFLPEVKKSRRIAGNLRSNTFMGTDLIFADIDNKDMRESKATLKEEASIGKFPCFVLEVLPSASDAVYGKIELWVRKDDYVMLRAKMFDKNNALVKTLEVLQTKKTGNITHIARAEMTNQKEQHSTELLIEHKGQAKVADEEFTVRNLEKL